MKTILVRKTIKSFFKISSLIVLLLPFSFKINSYINEDNQYYFLNQNFDIDDVLIDDDTKEVISATPTIKKENNATINFGNGYENISYSKEFTSNYFKNLTSNKPSNYDGICGYTSLSMLLSFYDVYFDDDIIDNKYQNNMNTATISDYDDSETYESPGVYDKYISKSTYTGELENKKSNYISAYKDNEPIYSDKYYKLYGDCILNWVNALINSKTFLGYLANIALDNDIIAKTKGKYYSGLGINETIENTLISSYIENSSLKEYASNFYFKGSKNYLENKETDPSLRNKIISYLKKGHPIIVGGTTYNGSGHVFIAYEYDEENDIIYGNAGWGNSYNHVDIEENIVMCINDFFGIDISSNLIHKHSLFYKNYDSEALLNKNKYICSCKLNSHKHNYIYESLNNEKHLGKCFCGSSKTSIHTFNNEVLKNGKHYSECNYCLYLKDKSSDVVLNPFL